MSRFVTLADIYDGKCLYPSPESKIEGTSMTIPGQGSNLAEIIASIVKLPPMDERDFDIPAEVEPDLRSLAVKTDLESMYTPEGVNLAKDAKARQNAKEIQKKADEVEKEADAKEADNEA